MSGKIIKIADRRELLETAAEWFSEKWSIPAEAYLESMNESLSSTVPSWYVYLEDGKIVAGMGVIENDFHSRPDLAPNVCAVYRKCVPRARYRG